LSGYPPIVTEVQGIRTQASADVCRRPDQLAARQHLCLSCFQLATAVGFTILLAIVVGVLFVVLILHG
jgi:hypothetical protein